MATDDQAAGTSPGGAASVSPVGVRRVVTAKLENGKSVFVSDGDPPRRVVFHTLPGAEYVELWSAEQVPTLPLDGPDPTVSMASFVPGPGGTRYGIVVIPPDSVVQDAVIKLGGTGPIFQEYGEKLPGLAEASETDHPGMHTTHTVDYDVIISGEAWLELDDGVERHLKQGDFLVQHGTRHAWRNKSSAPCVVAYVMVGAQTD